MKISNLGSTKSTSATARKKRVLSAGESDFASELLGVSETPAAGPPVETHAVGTVESILSVQEVPDASDGRSRGLARQYGDDILDRLDSLRRDVLLGATSKEKLADLAHALRARQGQTDDPQLKAIIDEIELRAQVEIAKFTRTV